MPFRVAVGSLFLLGACAAWPISANAETQADRDACMGDVHEHCGEFIPNREAIIQCLKHKIKVLSPACRTVMSRPYKPDHSVKN